MLFQVNRWKSLFQSTLPYGSDSSNLPLELGTAISIHAPLRERYIHHILLSELLDFNPRSLTGATGYNLFRSPTLEFQSTLPYGSDLYVVRTHGKQRYFNPRSLTGARNSVLYTARDTRISIHAPLRERKVKAPMPQPSGHFNPRSLTGAIVSTSLSAFVKDFNPRSLTGAIVS